MSNILRFPQKSAASTAWDRFAALVRETAKNPLLVEDPAHAKARREAHERFVAAFRGEAA